MTFAVPLPGARRGGELARAAARARRVEQSAAFVALEHRRTIAELEIAHETQLSRRRLTQAEAGAREEAAATMARAYALGDGDLALITTAKRDARHARVSADDALYDAWLAVSVLQLYGSGPAEGRTTASTSR